MSGPAPGTLRRDAVADIPDAVGSVPDGMASAVLAGVNPVIATTTAAALAAGFAIHGFDAAKRPEALFILAGVPLADVSAIPATDVIGEFSHEAERWLAGAAE